MKKPTKQKKATSKPTYKVEIGLTEEQKKLELESILKQLEERNTKYLITDFKYDRIPQQNEMVSDMVNRLSLKDEHRIRFYLYY